MADDLITIVSFRDPVEAQLAKGRLECDGIDCFLGNDFLSTIDFPTVLIDGGVHLRVRESDADNARKALDLSRD